MRSRATATESTSKPGWASPSIALGAAVATAAYLAATMIGLELSRRGGAAVVLWPAGGVLLAILVRTRLAAWPLYVAGCAAAGFAATMLFGASAGLALGLAAVNVIEAAIGAALLRRMFATPASLSTLGEGAAFLAAAVLAAPAAGALLGGGLLAAVEGASIWHEWQAWFAAHAVGVIVVAPALITWSPRYLAEFRSPRRALEGVAFVAVLAAVSFLVLTARGARHLPSRHPVGCNPVRYIRLRRGGACGRPAPSSAPVL